MPTPPVTARSSLVNRLVFLFGKPECNDEETVVEPSARAIPPDLSLPRLVTLSLKRPERIGTGRASASTRSWYHLLSSLQTPFVMDFNAKSDLEGADPRCRLCSWFRTRVRGGWFCNRCEAPFQHRSLVIEDTSADRSVTSTNTMSGDENSSMQEMDVEVSTGSHSINAGDEDGIPSQVCCSNASSYQGPC